MTAPVDIANLALLGIGAQAQVTSINPSDGSTEGDVCSTLYQSKMDSLSRAAHWNCLRKQVNLTQLKALIVNGVASTNPPPQPWAYEYAYPSDCLQVRYVCYIPTITTGLALPAGYCNAGQPQEFVTGVDVDANGNQIRVILTNTPQALCIYTARIDNPDIWDPHFVDAAVATLGAFLVNPLNRSASLLKSQFQIADSIVKQARISDGNEGFTSTSHEPDWVAARGSRSAWPNATWYGGWQGMVFPGGFSF